MSNLHGEASLIKRCVSSLIKRQKIVIIFALGEASLIQRYEKQSTLQIKSALQSLFNLTLRSLFNLIKFAIIKSRSVIKSNRIFFLKMPVNVDGMVSCGISK